MLLLLEVRIPITAVSVTFTSGRHGAASGRPPRRADTGAPGKPRGWPTWRRILCVRILWVLTVAGSSGLSRSTTGRPAWLSACHAIVVSKLLLTSQAGGGK